MIVDPSSTARIAVDRRPATDMKPAQDKDWLVAADDSSNDRPVSSGVATDGSEATAVAQLNIDGIAPTMAPLPPSIGEVAQAATTQASDTSSVASAPAIEGATAISPWMVGGAALFGIGGIAAIAHDDNRASPVAAEPPPAPPIGSGPVAVPPENAPPIGADKDISLESDGTTALDTTTFGFSGPEVTDTLKSVKIEAITTTNLSTAILDETSGHGYQFVSGAAGVTWQEAHAAANAAGGHLLVIDSDAEIALVRDAFSDAAPNGLGDPSGATGSWIGLSQEMVFDLFGMGEGWKWVSTTGVEAGGADFPGSAPLWNAGEPNDIGDGHEHNTDQFAAIFQGDSADDTRLIYDYRGTLPNYIVEYESVPAPLTLAGNAVLPGQVIDAADLDSLSWNSVFNNGGTVTFTVTDSADQESIASNRLTFAPAAEASGIDLGAGQSVSSLVDDQHLYLLA